MQALTFGSHGPATHQSLGTQFDEDSAIFYLELLMGIAIKNRDRLADLWPGIKEHLAQLISSATKPTYVSLVTGVAYRVLREGLLHETQVLLPDTQILLPDTQVLLRNTQVLVHDTQVSVHDTRVLLQSYPGYPNTFGQRGLIGCSDK